MPPLKYAICIEPEAQAWLDQQPEDVQKRVLLILDTVATFAGRGDQALQLQNPRWFDPQWGWARRIRMESVSPGLRCIYFAYVEAKQMIVVKFGTHTDDVYENGN